MAVSVDVYYLHRKLLSIYFLNWCVYASLKEETNWLSLLNDSRLLQCFVKNLILYNLSEANTQIKSDKKKIKPAEFQGTFHLTDLNF